MTPEEIDGLRKVSVDTIKSQVRTIYNKLGAANRADAVRIATISGMIR